MNAHSRHEYEMDTVRDLTAPFRAVPALSDVDRDAEWTAQNILYAVLNEARPKLLNAAALSDLRREAIQDLIAAIDDARPDRGAWDEAINAKRRGWE
jgi:hypothetical protein